MPFVTKLNPARSVDDRRSDRRLTQAALNLWSREGRPFNIIVHDISLLGFRAEFSSDLEIGDEVGLRIGHRGYVPARIRWMRGRNHGCEFVEPITEEQLEAIVVEGAVIPAATEIADTEIVEGAELRTGLLHRHARLLLAMIFALIVGELVLLLAWMR